MFCKTQICLPSVSMHDLVMHTEWNRCFYAITAAYLMPTHPQKIVEQVEKNHFYKMNGDVGMEGW